MIYTLEEIAERIRPVAEKYKLPKVWIFGSYARGEATDESDVDILVDVEGSIAQGWKYGGLFGDFQRILHKDVDMICVDDLITEDETNFDFIKNVRNNLRSVYEPS
jgi:predicted nucleotidyltransferase